MCLHSSVSIHYVMICVSLIDVLLSTDCIIFLTAGDGEAAAPESGAGAP